MDKKFSRGQSVTYTDRQGVTVTTRVSRVVNVQGATKMIRYYALAGVGCLVADGIEAAA